MDYINSLPLEAQCLIVPLIFMCVVIVIAGLIGIIFPVSGGDPDGWDWDDPDDYTGAER